MITHQSPQLKLNRWSILGLALRMKKILVLRLGWGFFPFVGRDDYSINCLDTRIG